MVKTQRMPTLLQKMEAKIKQFFTLQHKIVPRAKSNNHGKVLNKTILRISITLTLHETTQLTSKTILQGLILMRIKSEQQK